MPKQIFQRPSNVKLGNPGKNNKFGGQPDWGRKKGKPERINKPVPTTAKPGSERKE